MVNITDSMLGNSAYSYFLLSVSGFPALVLTISDSFPMFIEWTSLAEETQKSGYNKRHHSKTQRSQK